MLKKTHQVAQDAPTAHVSERLGLSDLEKSLKLINPMNNTMNSMMENLVDKQKIKRNQFGKSRIPKKFSSPTTSNPTSEELMEVSTSCLLQEETKKAK